jgi:hypothetical protein
MILPWIYVVAKYSGDENIKKFVKEIFDIFDPLLNLNLTFMANDFKPTDGGKISTRDAKEWIAKYDKERKEKGTRSIFYGKDVLNAILAEGNCAGISFFFAKKYSDYSQKEELSLVLVGTTEDGQLLWPDDTGANILAKDDSDSAYDTGPSCPPYCPK